MSVWILHDWCNRDCAADCGGGCGCFARAAAGTADAGCAGCGVARRSASKGGGAEVGAGGGWRGGRGVGRRRDRVRRGRGDGRSLRGAERCASVDCALPDGGVRGVLVRAAREKTKPYAGTALYSLAEDKRATREQEGELKRLTLALCKPGVNNVARIAAIQLAGQRGYAEALPILREVLSGARRDAVLDTVCIGSIGLLGNADDIALIERFAGDSRRSAAVEAAIKRIKGREDIGTPTAGKEASLTLRPLLRAVQPHEIRSDGFGGLGAVPPDKENIVGGNNRGFATRS